MRGDMVMVAGAQHWDVGGGGCWEAGWMRRTVVHSLGLDCGQDVMGRCVGGDSP